MSILEWRQISLILSSAITLNNRITHFKRFKTTSKSARKIKIVRKIMGHAQK